MLKKTEQRFLAFGLKKLLPMRQPIFLYTSICFNGLENMKAIFLISLFGFRPTAPLRAKDDIEGAIRVLIDTKADWVRSVCLVDQHPYWMYTLDGDRLKPFLPDIDIRKYFRSQLLPPIYRINGAVDVTWQHVVMQRGLLYMGNMERPKCRRKEALILMMNFNSDVLSCWQIGKFT